MAQLLLLGSMDSVCSSATHFPVVSMLPFSLWNVPLPLTHKHPNTHACFVSGHSCVCAQIEGDICERVSATVDEGVQRSKVSFVVGDACALPQVSTLHRARRHVSIQVHMSDCACVYAPCCR